MRRQPGRTEELRAVRLRSGRHHLQAEPGLHGSFSRADTHNFTAAARPDFKGGYDDPMPVSNADLAVTIADLLGLRPKQHGPAAAC